MKFLSKKVRVWGWLMQSLIIRYKTQLLISFFGGIVLVIIGTRILYSFVAYAFPKTEVIGIVGLYKPSKLPIKIQNMLSQGFTTVDDTGKPKPNIATNWEISDDGKRYFFHLNPNLTWHDNETFTAYDVNYNFSDVSISTADRNTLKIELNEPFIPLLNLLSRPLFKQGLVGLGEYKVVNLKISGEFIDSLTLYPVNRPDTIQDDRIGKSIQKYVFYKTFDEAKLAFMLGQIDILENIPSTEYFENMPNITISKKTQYDRFMALFFNTSKELLKDKEMRQTLSYATPNLEGEKALSPLPPTSWAYNANVKDFRYNMDQAKNIFNKQKIASDSAVIEFTTYPENLPIAEKIAESWKSLGIKVTTRVTHVFPSDYDIFLGILEIPSDPDQYQFWHSTQTNTNITRYNNPKIDKLLEYGRKELDSDKRRAIYMDFQKFLVDDAPVHFLIHPTVYTITRK